MVPHTGAVLALIDVVLAGATPATIKQSALKCLASWLHLTPDPASTCLLTLGTYRVYAAPKNLEVSYHQAERAKCLSSWLHLTPDPASTCLLTLGTLPPKNTS